MDEEACVGGFCRRCGREHRLDSLRAREAARELRARLDTDPGLRPLREKLFGPGGGKMLGVLLARDAFGQEVVCKGFSGQIEGSWFWPGWVEPVVDPVVFQRCQEGPEREIKTLTRLLSGIRADDPRAAALRQKRKQLSRRLMTRLFALYRLPNFRGEERPMTEVFAGEQGMPTGTGDCCAPKLLVHAARNNLMPLSLCEFFYGRPAGTRQRVHGRFYPPCHSRCRPLLGYLLCGLE